MDQLLPRLQLMLRAKPSPATNTTNTDENGLLLVNYY